MILHIVRSGDTVRKIADNYQCEVSDITSNNLHITDFKNLKPGMKLKIPFLSKPIIEVLEETESFISDYYPSLTENFKEDNLKNKNEEEVINETFETLKEETNEQAPIIEEEIIEQHLDNEKVIDNTLNKVVKLRNEMETHVPENLPFKGGYSGHIPPSIPNNFIRKI